MEVSEGNSFVAQASVKKLNASVVTAFHKHPDYSVWLVTILGGLRPTVTPNPGSTRVAVRGGRLALLVPEAHSHQ